MANSVDLRRLIGEPLRKKKKKTYRAKSQLRFE